MMMKAQSLFGLVFIAVMAVILVTGMPGCRNPVEIDTSSVSVGFPPGGRFEKQTKKTGEEG